MKICPNCGAQMNDDSLFCTECGKQIPQGIVCPHCGVSLNEGDVFCQSCGKRVDDSPSTDMSNLTHNSCPYCGASINEGDVFCENCGRNLSDGSIGFIPSEIQQETYLEEESSSKKILPIILGILAIAIIGGGVWYWSSKNKQTAITSTIVPKNDSINADAIIDTDSIEVVDSVADDGYYEEVVADSIAVDNNYEAFESVEEDVSMESIEDDEPKIQEDVNEVLDIVEQMPSFPGGQAALLRYLSSNVQYPTVAEENGVQGRVIVTFVVERDGSITDVRVAKSVDPSLDREAVRVARSMPRWQPGTQDGKPVRVKYTVPVTFRLE